MRNIVEHGRRYATVMHRNLPTNPVDLEQREGRVHRYNGHAVRCNVAQDYAHAAFHASVDDPWYAMFLAAMAHRQAADDLTPSGFIRRQAGRIERYVPAMPLSKESNRYRRLLRTVGADRLVLGQPRATALIGLPRCDGGGSVVGAHRPHAVLS